MEFGPDIALASIINFQGVSKQAASFACHMSNQSGKPVDCRELLQCRNEGWSMKLRPGRP